MKLNIETIKQFFDNCYESHSGAYSSSIDGPENLYATCYALMTKYYIGLPMINKDKSLKFIINTQDPESGYFIGPELKEWEPPDDSKHNLEHLLMHLTCTALPVLTLFGIVPRYKLKFADRFFDKRYLMEWMNKRDWTDAWLEGNNLFFIGQFLVYLRDQGKKEASDSLELYLSWLDEQVDPDTGLWGTNGYCTPFTAMCGGYHQLLIYYYENREIKYKKQLIDTVLSLQHLDGGFHPKGGGGACEDADAGDILVNMYKQINYRRIEIRLALRKLMKSILKKQMPDGGFVYRYNEPFSHMEISATISPANLSNMFPTWFRIHTLALISEILVDEPVLNLNWKFNNSCSMGWHRSWDKTSYILNWWDRYFEKIFGVKKDSRRCIKTAYSKMRNFGYKINKRLNIVHK